MHGTARRSPLPSPRQSRCGAAGYSFAGIDGGTIDLEDFAGQPVLVVNTASLCGFTPPVRRHAGAVGHVSATRGLVVLAVPSNDFSQELASEGEVKEFCEMSFDMTLPMTEITPVTGRGRRIRSTRWLAEEHGFEPAGTSTRC